jgi:hypothetical protein
MRIGRLEIRWIRAGHLSPVTGHSQIGEADLCNAFAVPDTTSWWLALLQVLDTLEREMIDGGRKQRSNVNLCLNAHDNAEGVALVREKFIELREQGLGNRRADTGNRTEG